MEIVGFNRDLIDAIYCNSTEPILTKAWFIRQMTMTDYTLVTLHLRWDTVDAVLKNVLTSALHADINRYKTEADLLIYELNKMRREPGK